MNRFFCGQCSGYEYLIRKGNCRNASAKPGVSDRDRPGRRSEVIMKFSSVLILAFISVFCVDSFAQSRPINASYSARVGETRARSVTVDSPKLSTISAGKAFELEKEAFNVLNQKRVGNGLPALRWSDDLARLARFHSHNMADQKFFSHRGLDGSMVDGRADSLGIKGWLAIGENIAFSRGYADPVNLAITQWMGSSAHRRNLLNEQWIESAVGLAVAPDGGYYFTQVFTDKEEK